MIIGDLWKRREGENRKMEWEGSSKASWCTRTRTGRTLRTALLYVCMTDSESRQGALGR